MQVEMITDLMTDRETRTGAKILPEATMITPQYAGSFRELLERREDIRCLRFLPVKTDEMRALYKSADEFGLSRELRVSMGMARLACASNRFPYFLPPDVDQQIIWLRHDDISDYEIARFISYILKVKGIRQEELILFERPPWHMTDQLLIKGTFPHFRHIHMWVPRIYLNS
jgi:hypothetical protein